MLPSTTKGKFSGSRGPACRSEKRDRSHQTEPGLRDQSLGHEDAAFYTVGSTRQRLATCASAQAPRGHEASYVCDRARAGSNSIRKGTRVRISLWDSLMLGQVPGTCAVAREKIWGVFGSTARAHLDEEFVPPALQRVKRLDLRQVVHQHARVRTCQGRFRANVMLGSFPPGMAHRVLLSAPTAAIE